MDPIRKGCFELQSGGRDLYVDDRFLMDQEDVIVQREKEGTKENR